MQRANMKILFVTGIQRSGTTALANIMNCHSEMAVCIERYKNLMLGGNFKLFGPELFDKDNLLDFSNNYTNCTPEHSKRFADFYRELEQKYSALKYIGDKVPNSYSRTPAIYARFPAVKLIFIVRNITDTACSWQTRAERVDDGWPATKTAVKAVERWNDCNTTILEMKDKYPIDVHIVDYTDFFDGDPDDVEPIVSLLDFLALNTESSILDAFIRARTFYRDRIKNKERHLSVEVQTHISANADMDRYQKVMDLAHYHLADMERKAA